MTLREATALGLCGVLGVLTTLPIASVVRQQQRAHDLAEYELFLREHRYNAAAPVVTEEERKEGPNPENPGERFLQEFLLTVDPATNTVPAERLIAANEKARALRRRRGKASASPLTSSWTERGPTNVGGRTRAIMFDPTDPNRLRVFAGGVAGGLWYTNDISDPSEPWYNVDDFWTNIAISTIAYDPSDTDTWYVGTGEGYSNIDAMRGGGVFKSVDAGATWALLGSTTGTDFRYVQKIVVTSSGAVLAATKDAGVLRSINGGTTWTKVLHPGSTPATQSIRAADLEIAADGDIFAAMGLFSRGQVFKSEDDGVSWQLSFGDPTGSPSTINIQRIDLATAPSDANRVYLVGASSSYSVAGLWRSDNGGSSWQSISTPSDCNTGSDPSRQQAWYDLILAVNPADPDHVVAGMVNLTRSLNAGSTWSNISAYGYCSGVNTVHPDHHAFVFRPGSSTEAVSGNDGGVYYTSNETAAIPGWTNRNLGYNVTQFYSIDHGPSSGSNLIVGGTQDNGTPKMNGAGASTGVDETSGDGAYTHINQRTNGTAFASNQWLYLHYSSDGGHNFSYLAAFSGGGAFINPSDLDDNTDHLFFNYTSTGIARLEKPPFSGAPSAQVIGPGGGMGEMASAIRASPHAQSGKATVYVGTRAGRLYRVANAHQGSGSWTQISLPPSTPGAISSIDFGGSEDTLLVTISNYGKQSVWLTHNGGATWSDLDTGSNLPDFPVWWGMFHPDDRNHVLIGTEAGLWYTQDASASPVAWDVDDEIPITRVVTLRYRPSDRQVLAATHGRGAWTATLLAPSAAPPTPTLYATALLEGGYSVERGMSADDDYLASIPTSQPYSDPVFDGTPMDYDGSESVAVVPAGVIDWVLLSLRASPAAEDEVDGSMRPLFVKDDGSIVDLDGEAPEFPGLNGSYHVVIRHRNHLPVMSSQALSFNTSTVSIDFTSGLAAAYSATGPAMNEIVEGLWVMPAADSGGDGQITVADYNVWLNSSTAAASGYVQADFDLNGQVTAADFNVFLRNTKSAMESQVP